MLCGSYGGWGLVPFRVVFEAMDLNCMSGRRETRDFDFGVLNGTIGTNTRESDIKPQNCERRDRNRGVVAKIDDRRVH